MNVLEALEDQWSASVMSVPAPSSAGPGPVDERRETVLDEETQARARDLVSRVLGG